MGELLRLTVHNYRCLRDVDFRAGDINVLFGRNGVGKTTFLDALWFIRDCAIRGTAEASSDRHHGIGALNDAAGDGGAGIHIGVETKTADYLVTFGYSSGRIEPFVGERLVSKTRKRVLVNRVVGSDQATFYHEQLKQTVPIKLRDPEKLALSNFLLFCEPEQEALEVDSLLKSLRLYSSRAVSLYQLRRFGAESSEHTYPKDRWQNLWSALRNLAGRRAMDDRFDTIIGYMRKAFPDSFNDLIFEALGADRVTASFMEKGRHAPIQASGVSDGHLQLLGLLTSLFGDIASRPDLLLFDEPETSLHPHAIAVFAEAVRDAAANRRCQVFIATHSPVLVSQFDPTDVIVVEPDSTQSAAMTRLSDKPDLKGLLDQYSIGSLYMAEQVGQQSGPDPMYDGGSQP
ncbi:MAG: AAA family ATPase [Tepidisphaerales bacterium]